jgi:uncharacterized protein (DUF58 family)
MFISKRFILLIIAGIIPAALCFVPAVGAYAFLGYNFLIFMLLIIDFSITPGPAAFNIKRAMEQRLSLAEWNRIDLIVDNPSHYQFNAKIRDGVPDSFETDSEIKSFTISPGETRIFYNVKPVKRGEYVFLDMHIRITGILGLCIRSKTLLITDTIKVYPNLKDMRNHHLKLIHKRRLLSGVQKIRQLGIGSEFESIREYNPGDEYKHINWSVTAREGQLYVNQYEPEKNQYVYIMIDSSRVMNEEIGGIKRLDYAVNTAFIVAETAMDNGDNIGLLTFDNEIRRIVKPAKGTVHFQRLAESLYNIEISEASADYEKVFSTLQKMQNRRSLVLLFTDPYNFEHVQRIVNSWVSYAPKHRIIVLSIKNPSLALMAGMRTNDSEGVYLKSAALKLSDDRKRTFSILEKSGIPALESDPDKFTIDVINRYISLKMHRV